MTITKLNLTIATILFSAWFFMDSYFAHAAEVKTMKVDHQVNSWSLEQSLNYMQQKQIKSELRKEMRRTPIDPIEVEDLRETYKTLKARGALLQDMQDKAGLEKIKHQSDEKDNPILDIISAVVQ